MVVQIVVPDLLAQSWRDSGNKHQSIAEVEFLSVLICRAVLAVHPVTTLIVHYVDNDGVSDSLVKGTGTVCSLRDMLHEYVCRSILKLPHRFRVIAGVELLLTVSYGYCAMLF